MSGRKSYKGGEPTLVLLPCCDVGDVAKLRAVDQRQRMVSILLPRFAQNPRQLGNPQNLLILNTRLKDPSEEGVPLNIPLALFLLLFLLVFHRISRILEQIMKIINGAICRY